MGLGGIECLDTLSGLRPLAVTVASFRLPPTERIATKQPSNWGDSLRHTGPPQTRTSLVPGTCPSAHRAHHRIRTPYSVRYTAEHCLPDNFSGQTRLEPPSPRSPSALCICLWPCLCFCLGHHQSAFFQRSRLLALPPKHPASHQPPSRTLDLDHPDAPFPTREKKKWRTIREASTMSTRTPTNLARRTRRRRRAVALPVSCRRCMLMFAIRPKDPPD